MLRNSVLKIIRKPFTISKRNVCQYQFSNIVRNQPSHCSQLENGLIVATEERDESYNSCVALIVNAGSRYESRTENGLTHLFEHLVFKGTTSKSKIDLEDLISNTGATFRCITSREIVAYFAECLSQDLNQVTEILFDCVYRNVLSQNEIESQKNIIYQEMLHLDKSSHNILFDYLHSTAFQGTPLGQSVVGLSANIHNFNTDTVCNYLKTLFVPQRTILVTVGCVKHEDMVNLGNSCFSKTATPQSVLTGPCRYTGSEVIYRDDSMHIAHVAIAVEGPKYCSNDRLVMELAAIVVGGWDRSLPGGLDLGNRAARAASSGLSDCYKAFHFFYKDTGLWGTQFISPKVEVDNMLSIIQDEWMRLCNMITDRELIGPKRELKSKILMKTESATGSCLDIGKWVMYMGQKPPLHEIFVAIDKITADDMKEVCTKYIYDKCPVVASIGATECLPEYNRIRAGMYWLRV